MKVSNLLSEYFENQPTRKHRIFEGSVGELPVAVKKKTWDRDESGMGRVYEFTTREDLKDFVQATLDFDDESGTGFRITVEPQRVQVNLASGEGYRSSEWSMSMLDSIYSEITERRS